MDEYSLKFKITVQNTNKTHQSNTNLCQKEHHIIQLLVSIHTASSSDIRTKSFII